MSDLSGFFDKAASNVSTKATLAAQKDEAAPTTKENPKCDQVCTNGSNDRRAKCMVQCEKMQKKDM